MDSMNVGTRVVLAAIAVGIAAALWFLPGTGTLGSSPPPPAIELPAAPSPAAVDAARPADDDGGQAQTGTDGEGDDRDDRENDRGNAGDDRDDADDDRDDADDDDQTRTRADLRRRRAAPQPGADAADDADDDADVDADDDDDDGDDDDD